MNDVKRVAYSGYPFSQSAAWNVKNIRSLSSSIWGDGKNKFDALDRNLLLKWDLYREVNKG